MRSRKAPEANRLAASVDSRHKSVATTFSRRDFLQLTAALLYVLGVDAAEKWRWRVDFENSQLMEERRPKKLGTTFSQLQCAYLGLDYKRTFNEVSSIGLDCIRLCAYWNEIEPQRDKFYFRSLDWLIEECQKKSVDIVLALGMKAPRWPEFHFPRWVEEEYATKATGHPLDDDEWLAEATLQYIARLLDHIKGTHISYIQVENEAMSSLGIAGNRFISKDFLGKEIDLVKRTLPGQRILLTNSINLSPFSNCDRATLTPSMSMGDAVGINVYTKVPRNKGNYIEASYSFWRKLTHWRSLIHTSHKQAWIAEAQAEPWEWDQLVATEKLDNPSSSPEKAKDLAIRLGQVGYERVLLWGCEYWIWQSQQGNVDWIKSVGELVNLDPIFA